MHDLSAPHCSYCKHFETCFQVDIVVEWGYCSLKKVPSRKELENLKEKVELGDYEFLPLHAQELGLFVPTTTDCNQFTDLYPF